MFLAELGEAVKEYLVKRRRGGEAVAEAGRGKDEGSGILPGER